MINILVYRHLMLNDGGGGGNNSNTGVTGKRFRFIEHIQEPYVEGFVGGDVRFHLLYDTNGSGRGAGGS